MHYLNFPSGPPYTYCHLRYLTLGIVHKTVIVLLYPHLLSGCTVLATSEGTQHVPVPVCFGVHTVHNYEI